MSKFTDKINFDYIRLSLFNVRNYVTKVDERMFNMVKLKSIKQCSTELAKLKSEKQKLIKNYRY
jgi:hypothetical protein